MTIKTLGLGLLTLCVGSMLLSAPVQASAQTKAEIKHRQKTKNDWRNVATAAGAVGVYGLLKGNSTMALVGLGGALYSADRYEHDRKSQSATERQRARIVQRGYYYSKGHKYVKRTVTKNGHKYYKFVKAS